MRIVVWNCRMRLAGRKLTSLENLQPDVAVVPECACPDKLWGKQPLLAPVPMQWTGADENRGLAVLAFNGYRVARLRNANSPFRWALPVEIQGPVSFHLLAVWAAPQRVVGNTGKQPPAQPPLAIRRYEAFLAVPSVVAGDFHTNIHREPSDKAPCHAGLAAELERAGLASAYHVGRGELPGKETLPTSYARKQTRDVAANHVDYCFLPLEWCSRLLQVELGDAQAWVGSGLSRHVPLIVDIDLPSRRTAQRPAAKVRTRTDLER